MAKLAISSIAKITHDSSLWKEPLVHKEILVSGLAVFVASIKLIYKD